MKISVNCVFGDKELRKMWNEIGSKRDVDEFLKLIQEKRLNLLTMNELNGILKFINENVNLQFKLRSSSQNGDLVKKIKSCLYRICETKDDQLAKALDGVPKIAPKLRSESDEIVCDRIVFDLKLDQHHFLFHPIDTLLDVCIVGDRKEILLEGTSISERQSKRLKSGELEFHIYCLQFRFSGKENSIWTAKIIPHKFSEISDSVVVNSGENLVSFSPPKRTFLPPNNPFIVNPNVLKNTNNVQITLKENTFFSRSKLIIYLSLVHKQKRFPSAVIMGLLEHQTKLNNERKELSQQQQQEQKGEEDEEEEVVEEEFEEGEEIRDVKTEWTTVFNILDPLTLERVNIPVRGIRCDHTQIFDLKNVLVLAVESTISGSTKICCPECESEIPAYDLMLDSRILKILNHLPRENNNIDDDDDNDNDDDWDIAKIKIVNENEVIPIYENNRMGEKIIIGEDDKKTENIIDLTGIVDDDDKDDDFTFISRRSSGSSSDGDF